MNLNIINPRFLAPALLLLAAALGITGCSQSDDAPTAATPQPLNITVAPRPAFAPAGEGADTRSTVDGTTGKFAWEVDDVIYLHIKFNDTESGTFVKQRMKCTNASANPVTWTTLDGWDSANNDPATPIEWPLGADQAKVRAVYTNSTVREIGDTSIDFVNSQEPGKGAHMQFSATITPGQSVEIDLKHVTSLIRFTGLPAQQKYVLKNTAYYTRWEINYFYNRPVDASFTTDEQGNGEVYARLPSASDPTFTLELAKADEPTTTIYTATLQAQGTAGAYTMDGYIYDVAVPGSGDVNPDKYPDLLPPRYNGQEPLLLAIPGQTAYWVAPENVGGENAVYQWSNLAAAACPDGWHIPTKDEFVAMTGITELSTPVNTNYIAIRAVFPADNIYWSATDREESSGNAWALYPNSGNFTTIITSYPFSSEARIRCVRKK